jgi:hypothetical protein
LGNKDDGVFSFTGPNEQADVGFLNGTSMASPQAAGLGAYMWTFRDDWKSSDVKDRIINNAVKMQPNAKVIDAYASLLTVDKDLVLKDGVDLVGNAPIRLAILDVVGDNRVFDKEDLKVWVDKLGVMGPFTKDYSRWDLNGDGFTGAKDNKTRFNLDMNYDSEGGQYLWGSLGGVW